MISVECSRLSGAREVVMTFMMDVIEEVLKIFHVSRIVGSKSVLFTSASQPSRERKREENKSSMRTVNASISRNKDVQAQKAQGRDGSRVSDSTMRVSRSQTTFG